MDHQIQPERPENFQKKGAGDGLHIEIKNLVKDYASVRAVNGISLSARPGEIVALLGPNGAGKSSVIRMLVGLARPDAGEIRIVAGGGVLPHLPARRFGYLPEDRGLYQDRSVWQNLRYIGELRGLAAKQIRERVDEWLERFSLGERRDEKLKQLSKGNQQKVQLIATLLHQPDLVILDEPFSGLDPVNQEQLVSLLRELRDSGVTLLLSAHQMDLVERLADRMLLMNAGRAVASGNLEEIREQLAAEQVIRFTFDGEVAGERLAHPQLHRVQPMEDGGYRGTVASPESMAEVLRHLAGAGSLTELRRERPSLHQLYLRAVGNNPTEEALA